MQTAALARSRADAAGHMLIAEILRVARPGPGGHHPGGLAAAAAGGAGQAGVLAAGADGQAGAGGGVAAAGNALAGGGGGGAGARLWQGIPRVGARAAGRVGEALAGWPGNGLFVLFPQVPRVRITESSAAMPHDLQHFI